VRSRSLAVELVSVERDGSVSTFDGVRVGLRPVTLAVVKESARSAELWVVNHVSDSISVVRVCFGARFLGQSHAPEQTQPHEGQSIAAAFRSVFAAGGRGRRGRIIGVLSR
jgi:hypothetical protein